MRKILLAALALSLAPASALACDDHFGACEVEDWRWYASPGGYLSVDGVATCNSGFIQIRLYEGEGGRFLGVATGLVQGHTFDAIATNVQSTRDLAIKYSIDPDW